MSDVEVDDASYTIDLPYADSDYIQGVIKSTAEPYELNMLRAMSATLDTDDLVLDVGANIGNHTLYLAAVAGAQVIAYEPDSRLTEALTRSVGMNGLQKKISVRTVAVAESAGELVLVDDVDGNLGGQHVVSDLDAAGTRVPVVCLDDELPKKSVRAVKIDVEGYEINVLTGAQNLLERDHPDLWVECLDADHYREISRKIGSLGYRFNGVFNPSPTYHFVHDPQPSSGSFTDAVDRVVERFYADHASYVTTRESLLAANAKYRTITQQYGELRDCLFEESEAGPRIETSSLIALRHAEERSLELQTRLGELLTEKHHSDELHREEMTRLAGAVREIKADRNRVTRAARKRKRRIQRATSAEIAAATSQVEVLATQIDAARARCKALAEESAQSTKHSGELQKGLNERDETIAHLEERQSRYRADFDILRDYIARSDVSLETLENTVSSQAEEIEEFKNRLASSYGVGRALRERLAEQENLSRRLTRARDAQRDEVSALTAELQALGARHRKIQQELNEQQGLSRRLTRARDVQRSEAEKLRAELRSLTAQFARAQPDLAELSPLKELVAGHEATKVRLDSELASRERDLQEHETALADAVTQLNALRESRTYRAGKAWKDAATWRGFWALVPRLLKIAQERND